MINIPPIKPSTAIKVDILPDVSKTWKVNQVLNATTEQGGDALSKVVLRIGQHLVDAKTPIALKTGDQIQLLVKTIGDTPLLSIQTDTPMSALAINKLRLFIAQQQNLSSFVETVQKLTSDNRIPAEVKTMLNQLVSSLPSKEQLLQPAKLKQIIQNSGAFLEPKLATQNVTNLQQDIKAQLIKISDTIQTSQMAQISATGSKDVQALVTQFVKGDITIQQFSTQLSHLLTKEQLITLQNHLSDFQKQPLVLSKTDSLFNLNSLFAFLHKHAQNKQLVDSLLNVLKNYAAITELKLATDNALSSITSQQLTPLTKEADNFLLLLFGILIKDKEHINLIDFKIEEEPSNDKDNQSSWTVTLNFHFKAMGKFQAKIHLIDKQISAVFTAEQSGTVNLIENNLNLLKQAFKNIGFNDINLDVTQHAINEVLEKPENIQLLDEKA